MNYFQPYPVQVDIVIAAAWNAQLAEAAESPPLAQLLDRSGNDLFSRFVKIHAELRALPRGARRALQRRLACSCELTRLVKDRMHAHAWRALQHKLAWSLAGAALLLALGQEVQAVDITVNTTKPDINAADGKCSLIEAIANANNNAQTHLDCVAGSGASDTITLPSGTHTLTQINNGANGLPLITTNITIEGSGAKIARKKGLTLFRILQVGAAGNLTLNNLTMSGGASPTDGGAIFNQGTLTINNSTITGNTANGYGGGIYNSGTLTIDHSTLSSNKAARTNGHAIGGAVYSSGTLTVQNTSTVTKNTASSVNNGAYGGGITNTGTATISNSTISSNTAQSTSATQDANGGGIWSDGTLTVQDSLVTKNKTNSKDETSGGGIRVGGGTASISDSTISSNTASSTSGDAVGGGISNCSCATLTVDRSDVTKNTAKSTGNEAYGGGIYSEGVATITNTTISLNKAQFGAGLYNFGGTMTVQNSTISGNKANFTGGGVSNDGILTIKNGTLTKNTAKFGGGLYNYFTSTVTLSRTLISGNKTPPANGPEVYNYDNVIANDFNLFGQKNNAGAVNFVPGFNDIVPGPTVPSTQVLSSSLTNNGGPTPTHALVTGSPAIDAVPNGSCGLPNPDQRGDARPKGPACDIGAFEGPP